jgi:hypothetical protein
MSIIEDIKSIEVEHFAAYTLIFLSLVAPGFLIIYLFKTQLFVSFGAFKLIVFSVALSLPLPTLNTFISGAILDADNSDVHEYVLTNISVSFICLYLSILIAYLWSQTFRGFLLTISIVEIVFVLVLIIMKINKPKKP